MAKRLFSDGASGLLLAQVLPADTTITIEAGAGDNFPSPSGGDWAILTLEDSLGNIEIVKATNRVADTFTVVRAQEGTTALTFPASTSRLELRVTASAMGEFIQRTGDDITTELFFSWPPVLANDVSLLGEESDDTTRRSLVKVTTGDLIEFGDAASALNFVGLSSTFNHAVSATGTITQNAGSGASWTRLSSTSGLEMQEGDTLAAWTQGMVYLDSGVVTGGFGATGVAGGAVTRLAMGIGPSWQLETQALTIAVPWDAANGLKYGTGEVWHDGNSGDAKSVAGIWTVSGDWIITGAWDIDGIMSFDSTISPTIDGGKITYSEDNSVRRVRAMTQSAYNALGTYDDKTIYFIY